MLYILSKLLFVQLKSIFLCGWFISMLLYTVNYQKYRAAYYDYQGDQLQCLDDFVIELHLNKNKSILILKFTILLTLKSFMFDNLLQIRQINTNFQEKQTKLKYHLLARFDYIKRFLSLIFTTP